MAPLDIGGRQRPRLRAPGRRGCPTDATKSFRLMSSMNRRLGSNPRRGRLRLLPPSFRLTDEVSKWVREEEF